MGAVTADVKLYFQLVSKEYIEFLRDENTTDDRGDTLYDAWEAVGKSMPIVMDNMTIDVTGTAPLRGDANGSGTVDFSDLISALFMFGTPDPMGDCDQTGTVDFSDLICILFNFTGS